MTSLRFPLATTLAATFLGLGAAAHAQTLLVEGPTAPAQIGNNFDIDVTLQLPEGYYTGIQVKVTLPPTSVPLITQIGSASPTSGEFDNATYNGTTRTYTWNQIMPLDLTAGAGVRKFRVVARPERWRTDDHQPFEFTITATGDVSATVEGPAAPFADLDDSYEVTATGTSGIGFGHGINETVTNLGWGVSSESTPRTGLFRRFIFPRANTGYTPLDADSTWDVTLGANYIFVRAYGTTGHSSTTEVANIVIDQAPAAWTAVGSTHVIARLTSGVIAENASNLMVEVFVPCAHLGQSASDAAENAPLYTGQAITSATSTDFLGTEVEVSDTSGLLAGPTLTTVCGEGGGVGKVEEDIVGNGRQAAWRATISVPAGTVSVTNAMLVDLLPPETTAVSFPSSTLTYGVEDFTRYFCNFAGVFTGYFDTTQFLTERDAHCHASFVAGDTHLVFWSDLWQAADNSFSSFSQYYTTQVSAAWLAANEGTRIRNTVYFNGATNYGARGDTAVETGTEDPWEASVLSDPFPSDQGVVVIGSPTVSALIDANGGNGSFTFDISDDTNFASVWNPVLTVQVPPGVIITNRTITYNCAAPIDVDLPASPYTDRPLVYAFGSLANPYYLDGGCNIRVATTLTLDASYPFIDRQPLGFIGSVIGGNDATPATRTVTHRPLVTTGIDVQLESSCYTAPVDPYVPAPATPGMALFRAIAINRGSENLSEIELRFIVPANTTYVDAFVGPDFPAGVSIEVSRNGGSTWGAPPSGPDATVTDVRIIGFGIEGLGLSALRPSFYVAVMPTGLGAVVGHAWMETPSFSLGRTPEKETPFEACTGQVVIQKFFDDDGDGEHDAGEPFIGAGFVFQASQNGVVGGTATTGGDGRATFPGLAGGDWTIDEIGTPDTEGEWEATSDPLTITVVNGGLVEASFGNTCSCASTDGCRIGTCATTGACSYTNVADGTDCAEGENLCLGEMTCQGGVCAAGAPMDCDDDDLCTRDRCANGACFHDDKKCDGLTYYAPVTNASGAVIGAIGCTVMANGQVSCAMKGEQLELLREYGTICGQ